MKGATRKSNQEVIKQRTGYPYPTKGGAKGVMIKYVSETVGLLFDPESVEGLHVM